MNNTESNIPIVSVSEFLSLLNDTLSRAFPPHILRIEGEISDVRVSQNKWMYFDLKDATDGTVLKCFATVWQVRTPIEAGMRVRVVGYPKIYERLGSLSLQVQEIEQVGEGTLQKAYLALKAKLEAEGVFDVSRKRSIPRFPKRIGLITSREAAAYGDFLRILQARWGGVEVLHLHVHVQGQEAVSDIAEAFKTFANLPSNEKPEVLVLTRGGGSLEDLHAFNDEAVVRAVFASPIPVICAVGHERDESLSDFAADIRASTPSHAAEIVVPRREDVLFEIDTMVRHQESRLSDKLRQRGEVVRRALQSMQLVLTRQGHKVGILLERITNAIESQIGTLKQTCGHWDALLRQLDPTRVVARGYAIVRQGGRIIKDPNSLDKGDSIHIQCAEGNLTAEVLQTDTAEGIQQQLV